VLLIGCFPVSPPLSRVRHQKQGDCARAPGQSHVHWRPEAFTLPHGRRGVRLWNRETVRRSGKPWRIGFTGV